MQIHGRSIKHQGFKLVNSKLLSCSLSMSGLHQSSVPIHTTCMIQEICVKKMAFAEVYPTTFPKSSSIVKVVRLRSGGKETQVGGSDDGTT